MVPLTRKEYKKNQSSLAAVLYVISPFLVVDWIELFGRTYAPEAIGRFACFILPFTKISVAMVSHRFVDFAQGQCAAPPLHEPALSIIFYMLKIAIVMVAGVGLASWDYIIPPWALPSRFKKNVRNIS